MYLLTGEVIPLCYYPFQFNQLLKIVSLIYFMVSETDTLTKFR